MPTPTSGELALSGKIAFSIYDPEKKAYDLYVANIDGRNRHLTAERASQPAFSPDGQHVAFRSWRADALGLMVADAQGMNSQRITTYVEDALPAWSKDVPILAFASQREPDRRWRIYGVAVSGEYEWPFEHGSSAIFGRFPTWLPQSRVVYAGCVDNDCGIRLMYGDGSGLKALTTDPEDTAPDASPDGSTIAFMSDREDGWEVYVVGVDGEGLTRLTDDPAADGLPTWSPDGQAIAFVSNRGGDWAIWAMRPDGSEQRKLFDLEGGFGSGDQDWTTERISWGP
jgi:TolB protein